MKYILRQTVIAINVYEIFYAVRIRLVRYPDKPWERTFAHPLNDSVKEGVKILSYPENTFIMGRTGTVGQTKTE